MGESALRQSIYRDPVDVYWDRAARVETNAMIVVETPTDLGAKHATTVYRQVERRGGVWRIARRDSVYDFSTLRSVRFQSTLTPHWRLILPEGVCGDGTCWSTVDYRRTRFRYRGSDLELGSVRSGPMAAQTMTEPKPLNPRGCTHRRVCHRMQRHGPACAADMRARRYGSCGRRIRARAGFI